MVWITDEELGSSEESGKDWDELEEEARRGLSLNSLQLIISCSFLN